MTETLSKKAKQELALIVPNNRYDALAEFSAIVQTAGSVNLSGKGLTVSVITDNENMPALLSRLALTLMVSPPDVSFSKHITLTFTGGRELLIKLGIFTSEMTKVDGIKEGLLRGDSERRSFIRGTFLGSGFLSTGKNNHMELSFSGESLRNETSAILQKIVGTVGEGKRSGKYTLYLKSKEKISDVLVYMGATKASLTLQEEMLYSSIGKRVSATQNCDFANIDRAVSAANKQISAINALDESMGLENLDIKLQTTALLRLSKPEANLSELAEELGVSKSCTAHRLDKLISLAEKHKIKRTE